MSDEQYTEAELKKMNREELDDIATDEKLDPDDYRTKADVIAAILGDDDGAEDELDIDDIEHDGWEICHSCKYVDSSGATQTRMPGEVVDDMPDHQVRTFFKNGTIKAYMKTKKKGR